MRRIMAHGLEGLLLVLSIGTGIGQPPISLCYDGISMKRGQSSAETRRMIGAKAFQVGAASWYGEQYNGKTTASGEPFDMYDFTAAHRTLPFGTYVRVTNLTNGSAVIVRVNDRGPVVDGRIIDISYNAARALDLQKKGVQRVRLDF